MKKSNERESNTTDEAQQGFRQWLLSEFTQSKVRNPSFSLRAFAKKAKISPSAVSEIFSGRRRVTKKMAEKVLRCFAIEPMLMSKILDSFDDKKSKKSSADSRLPKKSKVTILSNDRFKIVTEWYHFAILSLMETKEFESNSSFISERLGIPPSVVESSLERLERVGLLTRNQANRLVLTGESFHSTDDVPSNAVKAAHASVLDLAQKSLIEDDLDLRDITTLTLAINPTNLPKAKKIIRAFRTDIEGLLESDPKSEVYMLNVNLFPLTKRKKK